MGLELGLEFALFNRENPLFDKKTLVSLETLLLRPLEICKTHLRVKNRVVSAKPGWIQQCSGASHAIMTKKTKAQSTPLAKAARQSLEELSSSEDEDKPTQRGAPVTGATVSPSSSSSSSCCSSNAASQKAGYCSKTHRSKSCRS